MNLCASIWSAKSIHAVGMSWYLGRTRDSETTYPRAGANEVRCHGRMMASTRETGRNRSPHFLNLHPPYQERPPTHQTGKLNALTFTKLRRLPRKASTYFP